MSLQSRRCHSSLVESLYFFFFGLFGLLAAIGRGQLSWLKHQPRLGMASCALPPVAAAKKHQGLVCATYDGARVSLIVVMC